jgi:hypothetical protein
MLRIYWLQINELLQIYETVLVTDKRIVTNLQTTNY